MAVNVKCGSGKEIINYKQGEKKMKTARYWLGMILVLALGTSGAWGEGLNAEQILNKADDVANAPKDYKQIIQLTLTDKNNQNKERSMQVMQKGSDRRMLKFLSPADQKGIGFLSLPGDVMYVYLPAFKKTRRIASHVKNTKFAGTDFTYEDLEAKRYSDKWTPKLVGGDAEHAVLELSLKPSATSDYSKMEMHVLKSNFYIDQIHLFDKGGKLVKVLTRSGIEQTGNYWMAKETVMDDRKDNHKTRMTIKEQKFDLGLSDDTFSERNLNE